MRELCWLCQDIEPVIGATVCETCDRFVCSYHAEGGDCLECIDRRADDARERLDAAFAELKHRLEACNG